MLRNYEMKDEIYCFEKFTSAKYGINHILTERNIACRGIPFVPNETFNFNYFRLGQSEFMEGKISSDYDTKYSVFVYHKNCETIYSVFHFMITQQIKNRRVRTMSILFIRVLCSSSSSSSSSLPSSSLAVSFSASLSFHDHSFDR